MQNILIIDDDPQYAQVISFALNQGGYDTLVVSNEEQAFQQLEDKKYDLILLDVFMPNKEQGLSILSKLYSDTTKDLPPIILMTSMPTALFQQEANIDQYLDMSTELISKSSNPKEIVERVKQILSDHNGNKEEE